MSELEWWAACFSINDMKDQPIIKQIPTGQSVEEHKQALLAVLTP